MIVNPGFFRTGLAGPESLVWPDVVVDDYAEVVHAFGGHAIAPYALPAETMERAIAHGLAECARQGATGPDVTPILLSTVARVSGGASLATNLAVLIHNARVGARVAAQLR